MRSANPQLEIEEILNTSGGFYKRRKTEKAENPATTSRWQTGRSLILRSWALCFLPHPTAQFRNWTPSLEGGNRCRQPREVLISSSVPEFHSLLWHPTLRLPFTLLHDCLSKSSTSPKPPENKRGHNSFVSRFLTLKSFVLRICREILASTVISFIGGEGGRVSREYTSSQSGTGWAATGAFQAGPNALAGTDF